MTGPRIPVSEGVSDYWAALDRHPADTSAQMVFAFGDHIVRALLIDGAPWFVLADVCRALDIANPRNVAARLADDVKGVRLMDTPGGAQNIGIVNEPGLYEVVIRSDKPEARRFRRWVTADVLPAIRKTGSYSRYPAHPVQLPSKKELAQWVVEAEERAEAAEARAAELAVPATAYQELVDAEGDYSVADAAKVLSRDPAIDIRERKLFDFMADQGWVFRRGGRWKAYRSQLDTGRLAEKVSRPFKVGERLVNAEPTVRVTPKGLADLRHLLADEAEGGQLTLAVVQ